MTPSKTIPLFIRLGLALISLVVIGWLWWPVPVAANDPIFNDVCDPDDGTPCQELTSLTGNNWSRDVALGDLDGNGTIDAFVVQGGGDSPQSNVIWLGDSGGDCPNPFNYELHFCEGTTVGGGDSRGVALADLDGDTDLDVYIANGGSGDTSDEVWLNQGGTQGGVLGTFSQSQVIANGATEAVALADLNNDTYPDAVVAGYSEQRIYWNQGDGTFNLVSTTDVVINAPFYDVAVADLDNDTRPDIVLAGESFVPTQVFWNESSGPLSATITAGPVLSTSFGLNEGLGLGPLNNDAIPDVFIANSGPNKVWFSNGDRTFTPGPDLGSDDDSNVALADFEGDGDLDAFVTRLVGFPPPPNGVWLNDGSGGFSAGMDSLGSGSSYAVALADMNNDNAPDAFVANSGGNKVYANSLQDPVPPGFFANSGQELGDKSFETVVVGDVDGDNDLDAITGGGAGSYVWVNQGGAQAGTEGVFSQGQTLSQADELALGDVDGDTDLDLIRVRFTDPTLLYLNQGGLQGGTQGMFADSGQDLGSNHLAVKLGDVDGDTDLDLMLFLLSIDQDAQLLINQGGDQGGTPGQFQDSGQSFSVIGGQDFYLHDLDSDTDLDLFFTGVGEVWLNQDLNSGVFSNTGELGISVDSAGFGDFDSDSDVDIFAATNIDSRIYINQGGAQGGTVGTFAYGGQSLGVADQTDVKIGDLTGNGIPDAFVTGYNNVNIWHNNGTGSFSLAQTFAGSSARDAALGDLDGDGDLDAFLATVNGRGGEVWLNGEDAGPIVTVGPTTIQGTSGQYYFHWWGTGNASLPLYLTHAATETQNLEVEFAYNIAGESDFDTDPISFEAGDTLELATAFSDEPGGTDEEVWNFYQGATTIPGLNWPMDVDLILQSPNLSLIGPDSFQIYFHNPEAEARNCYLEGIALMLELAGFDISAKIGAAADPLDLQLFQDLRDNVMAGSPQGQYYTNLYNTHSPELLQITASNTWLISDTLPVLLDWSPALQALVNGQGDTETISAGMVADVEELLRAFKALAGPQLRAVIEAEEAALDLPSFVGLDMDQAWAKVQERNVSQEVWLPIILK